MNYIKPIAIALFLQLAALLAPLFVLLALPFIRWDGGFSLDRSNNHPAVRGDMPKWLRWLETPDERLPGGLYEPTVKSVYRRFGSLICVWYWLGIRNRLHGLAASFGEPAERPWGPEFGMQRQGSLWWIRKPLLNGRLAFKAGYRVYTLPDKSFLAVPVFTVTVA